MTTRDEAMGALEALVRLARPLMQVLREEPKEVAIPDGGLIVVRPGSLLEADSGGYLGSSVFSAARLAVLEVAIPASGEDESDAAADRAALEAVLQAICEAIEADPTLSGVCGYAAGGQSVTDIMTVDGSAAWPTVFMGVRLEYDAPFEALA